MTGRLFVAAVVLAALAGAYAAWRRPPRRLGTSSLSGIGIRSPSVVHFTMAGCGPCRVAAPHLRAAADRAAIPFHQIDVGHDPDVARSYGIRRVPTFAVTGRGGRVLGVWTELDPEIGRTALSAGTPSD
jgi:thiol-disulfide isomerase/thioredoxin